MGVKKRETRSTARWPAISIRAPPSCETRAASVGGSRTAPPFVRCAGPSAPPTRRGAARTAHSRARSSCHRAFSVLPMYVFNPPDEGMMRIAFVVRPRKVTERWRHLASELPHEGGAHVLAGKAEHRVAASAHVRTLPMVPIWAPRYLYGYHLNI